MGPGPPRAATVRPGPRPAAPRRMPARPPPRSPRRGLRLLPMPCWPTLPPRQLWTVRASRPPHRGTALRPLCATAGLGGASAAPCPRMATPRRRKRRRRPR
eukprot:8309415-Alexandrium_andersonii.AAC.1